MSKIEATLATTHLDRHNEQMTVGALESMVDAANGSYIPVGIEHDPRIPPQGRVVRAWLVSQEDGSTAVKAEIEIFDGDVESSLPNDTREIRTKSFEDGQLLISFDRNFRDVEDQRLLNQLATTLDAKLQEEFKKAFDPISVLAIGGAFAAGAIATGFLSKLGEDGYEVLKQTVKSLFSKPKKGEKERLLMLEFEIHRLNERFIVEVIATNPTPEQIDRLLTLELERLDQLVDTVFHPGVGLKKFVFELEENGIVLKFAVRRDGMPLARKSKHVEA